MSHRPARPVPCAPVLITALALSMAAATSGHAQCVEGCTAIHTLEGEVAGDQFGWVSNDIGDVDDDGVSDFVLTAPTSDAAGMNSGRIYVYSGATGEEIWRATGDAAGWWLGHDANAAGDVNSDGVPDVIAGAPFSGAGRAIIYSGHDGAVIHTFPGDASGDQFGYRVHGGGDFNGDGHVDLVIGAREDDTIGVDTGSASVYSGKDFSLICFIRGIAGGDRFGSGVSFIGDVNHDGRDDIAIGAMDAGAGSGGLAYVYSWNGESCEGLYLLNPGSPAQNFGQWFMNGGFDVNRDGTPDVYVNDFPVNRAHVFSGVDGSKIWEFSGDDEGGFGIGRMVEDVDGDCFADLILAAWISDAGAPDAGKAFIYSGRTGEVLDTYTHDRPGAGFGFDANGMGDVDGDGTFDWLITAASDLSSRGRAYVIAGEILPPFRPDVDGDGTVGFTDLLALLSAWGDCPAHPEACPADVTCDGVVGLSDLLEVLVNWS